MGERMDFQQLKERQRAERDGYAEDFRVRIHRALSWLDCAEQSSEDQDIRFIALWIAFNAAYAQDLWFDTSKNEHIRLHSFLMTLSNSDSKNRFFEVLWNEFSGSVRMLLDNKYIFQPFWDWQNGRSTEAEFVRQFEGSQRAVNKALGNNDTATILQIVFNRLYTLRNQLIHGGATWNGEVNRDQIRDCTSLLGRLVPVAIEILMDNPEIDWGPVHYPVIEH